MAHTLHTSGECVVYGLWTHYLCHLPIVYPINKSIVRKIITYLQWSQRGRDNISLCREIYWWFIFPDMLTGSYNINYWSIFFYTCKMCMRMICPVIFITCLLFLCSIFSAVTLLHCAWRHLNRVKKASLNLTIRASICNYIWFICTFRGLSNLVNVTKTEVSNCLLRDS